MIRTLLTNGHRVSLTAALGASIGTFIRQKNRTVREALADLVPKEKELRDTLEAAHAVYHGKGIQDFVQDRLKVALREKGVRHDLIDALFALGNEDDLVRLVRRVEALQTFLKTDDGANLLVGYRRAANILKIEEKKDKREYREAPDVAAVAQAEEKALHDALLGAKEAVAKALQREDFAQAMSEMAKLRKPVDLFFDKVTVNADDKNLRENRLRLLAEIVATAHQVADFSKVEG